MIVCFRTQRFGGILWMYEYPAGATDRFSPEK